MRARGNAPEIDRCRRVGEVIRRELSALLAREVDDQRVRMVSITAVRVSRDLKQARVLVSRMQASATARTAKESQAPAAASEAEIEKALNHASKYLRYLLSQRLEMKTTPSLRFEYDHSIRRGVEMSQLIDSLTKKDGAQAE
ncbi:MAG: 30S ribosome-binding factor RbfA [bacterium]